MFDRILAREPVSVSGQKIVTGFTSRVVTLVVNITELPVGPATLAFSITEVDPGDGVTSLGNAAFSDPLSDRGTVLLTLANVQSSAILVKWTRLGTGTFPNVSATLSEKDASSTGQQDAGNSTSVVLASDQKVSIGSLPLDTYSAKAIDVSGAGDTTVHTPATGTAVRLHYLCVSAADTNDAEVFVALRFGGNPPLYKLHIVPGGMWARNIGAGRRYLQGAPDEPLTINLLTSQSVSVSIEYEEI